jgi:hypothetical protein
MQNEICFNDLQEIVFEIFEQFILKFMILLFIIIEFFSIYKMHILL